MALGGLITPFVWGEGGARLTPEEVARQRKVLAALAGKTDTSPVGHWTQGLARVTDAIGGVIEDKRLAKADEANKADASRINKSVLDALVGPVASAPSSGVNQELAASSPAPVTGGMPTVSAPTFAADGTDLGNYLSDPARRATLPAGMRNNNPGNIKFVGQRVPGIIGPSTNTDQGDPQAVFDSPESGMRAMHSLLMKKYSGGKLSPNKMIAGEMGWTPGNFQAAANVAKTMGIGPDDDIGFKDPSRAAAFMRALIMQEHGAKGQLYPQDMIASVVGVGPPTEVAALTPQAAIEAVSPASGYVDPSVASPNYMRPSDAPNAAPPLPAPTNIQSPPPIAQSLMAPAATSRPSINPAIVEALSSPYADEGTKRIAGLLLQQNMGQQAAQSEAEQTRQNWLFQKQYESQQQSNDPLRQLQLEKARMEVEQGRNPQRALINSGDGRLYDPNKGEWIVAPDTGNRNFRSATPDEVKVFGTNGQVGPDGRFYPVTPPQGTALSVDPTTGAVSFNQGPGVKPLTEAQSKDSFFTTRMTAATPTIDKFESALMSLPEAAAGAIPMNLGRYAQSEEYQLAKDAGRDFVNAYLRKDSGAALTTEEEKNYGELLLPQPGDKPAIIDAKRQRRQVAVEAIKSGMPPSAVDGVLRAIQSVPGADKPAQTTNEKKTSTGIPWSID